MQAPTQLPTTPPLSGADLVSKTNALAQALGTDLAGPDDPAAIAWPFSTWADTGNMLLKRRNAAGTAWVVERGLFETPTSQNVLSLNGGQLAGMRNKIINGAFQVNQRGYISGAATTAGQYTLDRWKVTGTGGFTFSTVNGKTTITLPAGQTLQQVIEGINLPAGDYVLSWEGTAQGRANGGAYGASGSVKVTLVGGANSTVEFNAGTLANVQFEPGNVATPFEYRLNEDVLCLRYTQLLGQGVYGIANPASVNPVRWDAACQLLAPFRANPTASLLKTNVSVRANGAAAVVPMALVGYGMGSHGGYVVLDRSSGGYSANAWILSEEPGFILVTAEL